MKDKEINLVAGGFGESEPFYELINCTSFNERGIICCLI